MHRSCKCYPRNSIKVGHPPASTDRVADFQPCPVWMKRDKAQVVQNRSALRPFAEMKADCPFSVR